MLHRVSASLLIGLSVTGTALAQAAPPPGTPPTVTTVLPANPPGVLLINTTPAVWAELDRFNPLPPELKRPFQLPFLPSSIDFAADIQPWLGDQVALTLLPDASATDGSPITSFAVNTVLVAPIKDGDRFSAFLTKLKSTRGQPEIERDYKGVTILQWSAPAAPVPPPSPVPPKAPRPMPTQSSQRFDRALDGARSLKALQSLPALEPTPAIPVETIPLPTIPDPESILQSRSLAIALLPGNVAVAVQSQALERLIDARTTASLAQNPLFQRTVQHAQFERSLLIGYGNVSEMVKFLANFASVTSLLPFPFSMLPPPNASQLEAAARQYSTVDSLVWLQPEGIHSQVSFYYTTPQPEWATLAAPGANQLLARLPSTTYLSANSRNFKRQWQSIAQAAETDLTSQLLVSSLRESVRTVTGLNAETEIIPWMDGEYALVFFPTTQGLFHAIHPKLDLGVGLVVQTSDRAAAEAALRKADYFIQRESRGEVRAVSRRLKGQSIVSWEGKDRGKLISVLSHTWVDANTLIVTSGAGPMTVLNLQPPRSLATSYTFQTATASFPMPNEGYFYVNLGASLSLLYNVLLPSLPNADSPFVTEFQRIIGTVRSVSTSNSATPEAARVDSLWVLAPVKR